MRQGVNVGRVKNKECVHINEGAGGAKDAGDVKEERTHVLGTTEVAGITGKSESTNTLCPKMI